MHFIFILKKDSYRNEQINEKFLRSTHAPSLISEEAIKYENNNFILYLYPYDHIDHETEGYSYYLSKDKILLINGLVNINNNIRNPVINEFFNQLKEDDELIGDYQLISIDKNGNGSIKTPPLSIRQLFYYEDENCTALSTEIKLIVDSIQKFRKKNFVNHFDPDFIEDSAFREWIPRKNPEKTVFKDINRILPYDTKYFSQNKIMIEKKYSIPVPQWFKKEYKENKAQLYDKYYNFLINFTESNLVYFKNKTDKIILGLTGGFDSRITASILSIICKKHQIPFECQTSGEENHPDVIISKMVAKVLDVDRVKIDPKKTAPFPHMGPNTKDYSDYALTFYISQGDFNSKDFVPVYNRKISNTSILLQLGNSGAKKDEIFKIDIANRWMGRRNLFNKNLFFPLFFTIYETWFALTYAEMGEKEGFKELFYEILKRSEPKLLDIPFTGDSLPQTNVKPYLTVFDSKVHDKEPFLWDYQYVRKNLKPIFKQKFNESLGIKGKLLFKIVGLNELDYFINRNLGKTINSYRKNQITLQSCFKLIWKEGRSNGYPKTKTMVKMTKENRQPFITRLQVLMDFATVSNKNSFEEIEQECLIKNYKIKKN